MKPSSAESGPATSRAANDPRRTRRAILDAATSVFAEKGFSGANVDDIVARVQTTKPTLYYHFGSKEGLFAAVLEDIYAGMRKIERSLDLDELPAVSALEKLVRITFDYHAARPDWIRLISVANIHRAKHIAGSESLVPSNAAILGILRDLMDRGVREGVFRDGVDPLHLHLLINSFCFYRVSNRHTWKAIFKRDLESPGDAKAQRETIVEAVLRFMARDGGGATP
jgi:AcrR family transcriptional regulator